MRAADGVATTTTPACASRFMATLRGRGTSQNNGQARGGSPALMSRKLPLLRSRIRPCPSAGYDGHRRQTGNSRMARRGTPSAVKVVPFKVPADWLIDGKSQSPGPSPEPGSPSPEFTEAEVASIVGELEDVIPSDDARREMIHSMTDPLNFARRFHAQSRYEFDHTPARRDINAALARAAQAVSV